MLVLSRVTAKLPPPAPAPALRSSVLRVQLGVAQASAYLASSAEPTLPLLAPVGTQIDLPRTPSLAPALDLTRTPPLASSFASTPNPNLNQP